MTIPEMAVEFTAVVEIGVIILVGLVFGIIFSRLKLSSTLGYLVAGLILGPLGFAFLVPGKGVTDVFGLIGMLMLLFYLGLELNLRKLRETGAIALVLSFAEMAAMAVVGFLIAKAFGFSDLAALLIGGLLISTSTVEAVEFVLSRGLLQSLEAKVALSALIFEDFAAILVLVLVSALASTQGRLNISVLTGLLFVVAMFYIVRRLSGPLLSFLGKVGQSDKMTIFGIGVGIFVSFLGAIVGLPAAIGAYFAGFALAETNAGETIKRELRFFREFFVLFFFVGFGASVFYDTALQAVVLPSGAEWLTVLGLLAVLLVGYLLTKIFTFGVVGTSLGLNPTSSMTIGVLMFSIGEFSILIAQAARPLLGRTADLVSLAFLLTISTLVLAPILHKRIRWLVNGFLALYPSKLKSALTSFGRGLNSVDRVLETELVQNAYARAAREVFSNLLISVAIVYVSALVPYRLEGDFLPAILRGVSVGFVTLPLVLYPLFRVVSEMRFLIRSVSDAALVGRVSGEKRRAASIRAADVFTGIILTSIGVGCTILVYGFAGLDFSWLVLPALYTLIAAVFLSRAIYDWLEQVGGAVMPYTSDLFGGFERKEEKPSGVGVSRIGPMPPGGGLETYLERRFRERKKR